MTSILNKLNGSSAEGSKKDGNAPDYATFDSEAGTAS